MQNYPNDAISRILKAETAISRSVKVLDDLLDHYIMGGQSKYIDKEEYLRLITMLDIVGGYVTEAQRIFAHTKYCEEKLIKGIWDGLAYYYGRPLTDLEAFKFAVALSIDNGKKAGDSNG